MKHFIVEIIYTAEADKIMEIKPRHREYLKTAGYDKGVLLMSGPINTGKGGLLVMRGESLEEIKSFTEKDPYNLEGAIEYRYIEFDPVMHQDLMKEWIGA